MSENLDLYLSLERAREQVCKEHGGKDSPEEDAILDRMDAAWYLLSEEEHKILDGRPMNCEELRAIPACEKCLDSQFRGRVGRNEDKQYPRGTHPKYDRACVWCEFCDGCVDLIMRHINRARH